MSALQFFHENSKKYLFVTPLMNMLQAWKQVTIADRFPNDKVVFAT